MKILVLSDSHGNFDAIYDITLKENPDLIIHLGDGAKEAEDLSYITDKRVIAVRGNCDWSSRLEAELIYEAAGKRLFICHGHTFSVKSGLGAVINSAHSHNCDVLLFGHTHQQMYLVDRGMHVLNPGSSGYMKQYGIIEISNDEINIRKCSLN